MPHRPGDESAQTKFSSTRFVTSQQYRESEGLPALRLALTRAWNGMAQESRETLRAVGHLLRAADGRTLTAEERVELKEQLQDLAKAIPMLTVFMLPGGLILLPVLLKVLPFDLRLSGFKHSDEIEPHVEAIDPSNKESKPDGAHTPID